MPELPEVETVRRMLADAVPGRTVARAEVSGHRLRTASLVDLPRALAGRTFAAPRRTGKFLLLDLDAGWTLLSHLGMSGRWLFHAADRTPDDTLAHVHLRITFRDRTTLWYQDVRRFGMLRVLPTARLHEDPSLRLLGPDPLAERRDGEALRAAAHGARTSIKSWLLDQRRIAGVGNIYASEVLHRTGIHPQRLAGRLSPEEWARLAIEIPLVLEESIARMGTTFSTFRNVWGEPGQYGDELLVYDREGEPCTRCGHPVRRIVQTGRATFLCERCQPRRPGAGVGPRPRRPAGPTGRPPRG
jgi:formamidopyrimidine-DNA glycosylase